MGITTGLMTFAEFERLPDEEFEGKTELIDGELIRMPPPKTDHMDIALYIFRLLDVALPKLKAEGNGGELGVLYVETGYRIGDQWLVPDVSITHPGQHRPDYMQGAPAIAIEVISKSNTAEIMQRKIDLYLENGAREVWVFYPRTRKVTIHSAMGILEIRDILTTPLLPGVTIDLSEAFEPQKS
jgi:Uma2 family endonuclease